MSSKALRERLWELGASPLSTHELLELVVRPRSETQRSAVAQLLTDELAGAHPAELVRSYGLSESAGAALAAALELGRRLWATPIRRGAALTCSNDVWLHWRDTLAREPQECFVATLCDVRNQRIRDVWIARGTLSTALVHPREVFAPALRCRAAAVIVAHNHPSGNVEPSENDRALTRSLRDAGGLVGIEVLDHVIVAPDDYYSFADAGALGEARRAHSTA